MVQVEYSWLAVFFFQTFDYAMLLPSGLQTSAEKSADNLIVVP